MKLKKILLIIGIIILLAPFVSGIYKMLVENWNILDWLILYSAIYYPTYVIGILFIVIYFIKRQ